MALVYVDSDPWFKEHEACEKLYSEIREQLTARSREQKTSQAYASLSAAIRLRLRQYSTEVQQLKDKLIQASRSHTITQREEERRSRLVELLQSKEVQLQQLFNDRMSAVSMERSKLMAGSAFADVGTTEWGTEDEPDETQHLGISDIRVQQQRMMQEQDAGLEALSKVISRQKEIAHVIGNEVDTQNEIIDDLADHMDRTDARLLSETKQVRVIDRKDRTWVYWVIILLLLVTIVIIALV